MTMEGMAPPVTHQTLAAWRSTLVKLRDEERRHAVDFLWRPVGYWKSSARR